MNTRCPGSRTTGPTLGRGTWGARPSRTALRTPDEPAIVLANEPTGALDPATGNEIMELFAELNGDGATIIVVTCNPEVARRTRIGEGVLHEEARRMPAWRSPADARALLTHPLWNRRRQEMSKTAFRAMSGIAAAAGFVLALSLLSGPALANQCHYSDGNHDDGPCVEVRNKLHWTGYFWGQEMNLWCHAGPTARSHKIILKPPGDSFTCRGVPGIGTGITVQRTQAGCNTCDKLYVCQGKLVLELTEKNRGEELVVRGCTVSSRVAR